MRHLSSKRMLTEENQPMPIDCSFPSPSTHRHNKKPLAPLSHIFYSWRSLIRGLAPPNLFLVNLQSIAILHLQRIRTVRSLNTSTIEQEADGRKVLALTVAERIHQLRKGSCPLDLEEDLIVVVCDFDIQVLRLGLVF